ncbi:HNH endonuclease [Rhizobium leguminosarum]|uniref:HNH endonuclease n=1 Tax=Rhizobium leguminosarum TaxID=384 RepID=UPI00103116EE|nr:hypothetical protein [Rhizobium leguminosarum]TAY87721.1 hypothetical protein ELH83_07745 [Rhizobium leguminosarum]
MRLKKSGPERQAINWALRKKKPWAVDSSASPYRRDPRAAEITAFKVRLKAFHLTMQGERCCYCRVPLTARNIETDREHIVPKDLFKRFTYEVFNTSVACKTCNMSVKNGRTEHLRRYRRTSGLQSKDISDERNYNIVHPNIHDWHEHVDLFAEEVGRSVVRIYYPLTWRGRFTYEFFKLGKLEIFNNTQAQKPLGAKKRHRAADPAVMEIAARFGQK